MKKIDKIWNPTIIRIKKHEFRYSKILKLKKNDKLWIPTIIRIKKKRFWNFNISKFLNSKIGKLKKIIRIIYMKMFQLLKELKKSTIFKSQYIKNFEYWIFEILKFLYFRFSNFIIFRVLNFKNVEIHNLKLTWQSISHRSI